MATLEVILAVRMPVLQLVVPRNRSNKLGRSSKCARHKLMLIICKKCSLVMQTLYRRKL